MRNRRNLPFTRATLLLASINAWMSPLPADGGNNIAVAATVGWRGDGTGAFPAARPVAEWSEAKNIRWKTPLPNWSNASPIVVGERVFVLSEPQELVCVSRDDGRILWRRADDHLDLILSDEEAARVRQLWQNEIDFERHLNELIYEHRRLKAALDGQPDDPTLRAKQAEIDAQIEAEHLNVDSEHPGYVKGAGWERDARRRELEKKYGLYFDTWGRWDYWIGQSMATPVSDGQYVYASYGQNLVVCYDLAGNRRWKQWFKTLPKPRDWQVTPGDPFWNGYPRALFVASPVLAGDRLIVQAGREIHGLDKRTGHVVWSQPLVRYVEYSVGTPAIVHLPTMDVAVTAFGDAYRTEDGKLLATELGFMPNGASPVAVGDTVYFLNGANPGGEVPRVRNTVEAIRLSSDGPDKMKTETVWKQHCVTKTSVSPVVSAGLLYHIEGNGLVVRDAETGERLGGRVRVPQNFPSLTLAGDYLISCNSDGVFGVVRAGRKLESLSESKLETAPLEGDKLQHRLHASGALHWRFMLSSPFVAGDDIFVRSYDALYCIGAPRR